MSDDVRTKGPYRFTPQELRRVEMWFQEVRDAADEDLTEKEILLLYAADRAMRPKKGRA